MASTLNTHPNPAPRLWLGGAASLRLKGMNATELNTPSGRSQTGTQHIWMMDENSAARRGAWTNGMKAYELPGGAGPKQSKVSAVSSTTAGAHALESDSQCC